MAVTVSFRLNALLVGVAVHLGASLARVGFAFKLKHVAAMARAATETCGDIPASVGAALRSVARRRTIRAGLSGAYGLPEGKQTAHSIVHFLRRHRFGRFPRTVMSRSHVAPGWQCSNTRCARFHEFVQNELLRLLPAATGSSHGTNRRSLRTQHIPGASARYQMRLRLTSSTHPSIRTFGQYVAQTLLQRRLAVAVRGMFPPE